MKFLVGFLWLIVVACLGVIVTQPVSLSTHFTTALTIVAIIGILKMFDRTGALRTIVLALGTAVVLRYVYWRTTTTIPPVTEITNFIPGFLLYLAEMYSVFMLFLSLFVIADPLDRPKRILTADDDRPPVDIFVPTLNEDATLLATTLSAAKQIDYPADKLNVYLLDDGGTDQRMQSPDPVRALTARDRRAELQELTETLGVHYLTREANTHAKAGNLNNGLSHTSGEFIVVFDADHAPTRDFLNRTIGYFADDPRLYMVQTPHFFINPDPLEHNLATWDRMPSENEMFYAHIQKGLDKWNATFFCGSAAVLRRSALDEVGGFSGASITEDCETSLTLHSRKWNSAYVDRPMVAGLQPETFASFIGQRSRWCQGMMQILMLKRPMFVPGLTMAQRLCYLSSMLYWLFPLARLTFLLSPLCFLFFGLSIFDASGPEFAAYTTTYILVNILMQNYLWSRVRWPFISELYETIQSVYLIRALFAVLLRPRQPQFKVTAKGETNRFSRISELGGPFYVIFFILVLGIGATVYRVLSNPAEADVALVVGGWNIFNLILMGAALGVVAERRQMRTSQRVSIERPVEIIYGDRAIPAKIDDVSIAGARVLVPANFSRQIEVGDEIVMRFQPLAALPSNELTLTVRAITHEDAGIALGSSFTVVDPKHYELVADLVFANSDEWVRFQASRRHDIGVIRGVVEFLSMAAYQTVRGLSYLVIASPGAQRRNERKNAASAQAAPPSPNGRTRYVEADPAAAIDGSGSAAATIMNGPAGGRAANPAPNRW